MQQITFKKIPYEKCLEASKSYDPDVNYVQVYLSLIKHFEKKEENSN